MICDSKATLTNWNSQEWDKRTFHALKNGEPIRVRAIPPITIDPSAYWEDVFSQIYTVGNVTVYIDELYGVVPPGDQNRALWALYTRGREFGIGVWAATQRPVWVPLVALSEAEHYFMFRLALDEDKQRMSAFMGKEVLSTIKDKHGFFYMSAEADNPSYLSRLEA